MKETNPFSFYPCHGSKFKLCAVDFGICNLVPANMVMALSCLLEDCPSQDYFQPTVLTFTIQWDPS